MASLIYSVWQGLRGLSDALGRFSAIFKKEYNFGDFLFAFPAHQASSEMRPTVK